MKKYIYLILFFSVICNKSYAQESISTKDLVFHSPTEQAAFYSKMTHFNDRLALLLCVNPSVDNAIITAYEAQLRSFYSILEKKKIRKKSTKKATKVIFKTAHQVLLKNYTELAQFHQIFDDGTYNCLTATILLALTFDHFGIEYQVKELPTHVYITVEPNGINLTVETTDPNHGIFKVNKHRVIEDLERLQIISQQESRSHTVEELYQKYSVGEEQIISFKELAADLYYNSAIISYEAGQYEAAHRMIDKGLFLYPKRQANYTRVSIIYQLTLAIDLMRPETLEPLFILLKYNNYQAAAKEDLVDNLRFAAQKFLIENDNPKAYEAIREYVQTHQQTKKYEDLEQQLNQMHFTCFGYYKSLKNDYTTAIQYLDKAHQIAPKNLRIQSMLTEAIIGKEQYVELSALYEALSKYQKRYTFLTAFDNFNYRLMIGQAGQVASYFDDNQPQLGFEKLNELMTELNQRSPITSVVQATVSVAYAPIQSYYVRKGDYKNAQFWLDKGLRLAPDSNILKRKAAVLKEFLEEKKSE